MNFVVNENLILVFRLLLLKIQDKTFEHERKIEEIKELQDVPGVLLL